MSKLEKFINHNRDAFDEELPGEHIWQGVEKNLSQKEQAKWISISSRLKWAVAAAIIVIAGVGIFFKMQKNTGPEINTVKSQDTTVAPDLAAIASDALPEMNQFAKLIALKQDELKKLSKEQPELYQKFTRDINQLDSTYVTLKKQLSIVPNRELLIEAMIQNLQLQLQVLNQQLNIINQIKKSKNDSHEKNEIFM
jgi:uncharacterized membrane protein YdfJ with MMPL/SSD domain